MKNVNPTSLISKLQELAEQSDEIEALWLYGSMADQTADENSDIDLAIAFKEFIKDPLDQALRPQKLSFSWAEQLNIQSDLLSIVDINIIPTTLAWEVISKGVVLTEKKARAHREFDRISRQYELDIVYHRKHYG